MGQADTHAIGITIWLFGLAVVVCLFDLVRSSFWTSIDIAALKRDIKPFGMVAILLGAMLGLSSFLKLELIQYSLYLVLGLLACFVSGVIDPLKHRYMRATFLLACSAGLVMANPDQFGYCASAFAIGLLSWRLVANLLEPDTARLDDVAPAFAYLASMTLAACSASGHPTGKAADLVTGAFAVACLLNMMQRPFMHDDKLFVKRLVLVVAGGLGMLVVVTKGLNLVEYTKLSVLLGAGFGGMYALDALSRCANDEKAGGAYKSAKFIKQVLIVGIFTLIASRLFGNVGVGVLAACVMVGSVSQVPACFAAYLGARLFEQAFAYDSVANVTGINLMHPYVSAAQYFGFFVVVALLVMIKESHDRKFDAVAIALVGTIGTALVSYFLHGESTGSYLVALGVAGIVGTVLMQVFYGDKPNRALSLMLLPGLAGAVAFLSQGLVDVGLEASMDQRLSVIGGLAGFVLLLMVASTLINKNSHKGTGSSSSDVVAVPGE
jgi:hypothetical protein